MLVILYLVLLLFVFFFKQKTAYEMRISDWSSDVCSSDLWQHRDADRGARVTARLAEQRFEQLRRAVGDLRLIGEARRAVDEHAELDDALDARPVAAQRLPDLCNEHQRDALRGILPARNVDIPAKPAGDDLSVAEGQLDRKGTR